MTTADPYDLARFIVAQNEGATYARALIELRRGYKTSHWMWFVFPQIAGLGHSSMARLFAISSLDEAQAYLQHPVLGPRLIQCTRELAQLQGRTAEQIFGGIDTQKLRSSMTLFVRAAPDASLFRQILDDYFAGEADSATDRLLGLGPD